jgi:hypothetical protein
LLTLLQSLRTQAFNKYLLNFGEWMNSWIMYSSLLKQYFGESNK